MVLQVELQAICNNLGYQEGQKYVKEPDCLEAVKDLIRCLKREDETCDTRQELGQAQILQNDLIPLIKHYKKDRALQECVIRLMVNLTQPSILCFNNELPQDKTIRNHYLEVESHLQGYKEAFVDEELFAVLTEKMGDMLKLDWENRHEEDKMFIERLLILVRNILHVPPNPQQEKRTDDDASIHDQVLWALHVSGMEDLLLYIASSDDERQYCVHVLEIISLMFREQTPDLLAHAGVQRSLTEKEKDQRELEMARQKERAAKLAHIMKQSSRHSRFGGTYVMKNMKSISDRDVIYHKSLGDTTNISFDQNKKPKKQPRNRQAIKDVELVRRSTLSIRLALKDFCVQFLDNCYNPLMRAVKDSLVREHTQEHDETYYMWAMRFFMEFCRVHSGKVELVSETMSVPTFHYIYTNLLNYYEMIMTEKKEGKTWSRRVHLALKAYQELLMTLYSMDKSSRSQIRESSRVIKSNVFYMMEFRDIFLTLLRKFDESKQSRSYLKDLIETTHLFLKMLEAFCKQTSHLVVQNKKKKSRPRQKKQKGKDHDAEQEANPELEDLWDDVSSELSALIQGRVEIPDDVSPFDAASEVEVDQQRADAMVRIQGSLRTKEAGQALALFRSAREVWPDRGEFGTADISPEDEFMALREVFFANISGGATGVVVEESQGDGFEEEEDPEEEEVQMVASEQEFKFKDYAIRFGKPQILKAYVTQLSDFEKNSDHTNHCVIKMLHRVAIDLDLMGMMFQASLFRVFQKLLFSPLAKSSHFQELVKFGVHVIRHFVTAAPKNDKIFMELLFWKSPAESRDIVEGYGSSESRVKQTWTEDQEQELQRLFEEYRDVDDGRDAVDHIMDDITDREKTRGQIVRQLKNQGLIMSAKDLKRKTVSSRVWTEGQELELRDLFDTYRNSADPVGNIVSMMEVKRSKLKVIEKILELQLVEDRKELYKKRSGGRKSRAAEGSESEDDMREPFEEPEFMETNEPPIVDTSDEEQGNQDVGGDNSSSQDESVEVLLNDVISSGYRDQLGWIQRAIQRAADSRAKSENPQPVPIVPLTEDNEDAMEDGVFTKLLRTLCLAPPADEQETFWRIPADLGADDLKLIAQSLEINDENKFASLENLTSFLQTKAKLSRDKQAKADKSSKTAMKHEQKTKRRQKKETKTTDKAVKPKRKTKKQKADEMEGFIAEDSSDEENQATVRKKKSSSVKKPKQAVINDDSESDDEPLVSKSKGSNSVSGHSRVKRPLESDSDSDNERLRMDLSDDISSPNRPSSKRSRLAVLDDSDDGKLKDSDKHQVNSSSVKKSHLVLSGDSDGGSSHLSPAKTKKKKRKQVLDESDEESSRDSLTSSKSSNSKRSESQQRAESDDESSRDSLTSSKSSNSKRSESQQRANSDDESSRDSLTSSKSSNSKCSENQQRAESDISSQGRHSSETKRQKSRKKHLDKTDEESSRDSMTSKSSLSQQKGESDVSSQGSRSSKTKQLKNKRKHRLDESDEESSRDSVTSSKSSNSQHSKRQRRDESDTSSRDSMRSDPIPVQSADVDNDSKAPAGARSAAVGDDSDEDTPLVLYSQPEAASQKKADKAGARSAVVDDDSDDSPLVLYSQPEAASQKKADIAGARSAVVDDDSDEDSPLVLYSQPEATSQKKADIESFPATLLTQAQGDSDSDDDHIPLTKAIKTRRIADSDDDEDDE